jgi:hypothetical protein
MTNNGWTIETKDLVSYKLDDNHKFCIEKTENGFSLKVLDIRGYKHKPTEPILLFQKKISDLQLGYKKIENER